MSRIPAPDRLRLAEQIQSIEVFTDRVNAVGPNMSRRAATLLALHYESVAVMARLCELVDRGANSMLIDKASFAIQRWNEAVSQSRVLLRSG